MSAIKPSFEGLEVLRPYADHWCVWRLQKSENPNEKAKKVPYRGRGKGNALSATTMDGWLSFDEAARLYEHGGFDGVGLLLLDSDVMTCVDIDGCLDDDGYVIPTAAEVVSEVAAWSSYMELSQSGHGLHCFVRGVRLDDALEKLTISGGHSLEIYDCDSRRYLAVTGVEWPGIEPGRKVELRQTEIEAFLEKWGFVKPDAAKDAGGADPVCHPRSDDEVLKLLRERNKRGRITRLMAGDTGDFAGDHSAADFALSCEIAYYTRDPDQIDRIFRQSDLVREKWTEREDYRNRTIRKALKEQRRSYDSDCEAKAAGKASDATRVEELRTKGSERLAGGIDDLLDGKGRLRGSLHTVGELLLRDKALMGSIVFDEFSQRTRKISPLSNALGKIAPNTCGDIEDGDLTALAAYLGRLWGIDVRKEVVADAVGLWARALSMNPVTERLDELADAWDGKERLRRWLIDYAGAEVTGAGGADVTRYLEEVGRRWLIQMVARAYRPGCKADSMLVIEGRQGARKSTLARVLCEAVAPETFLEGFSLSGQSEQNRYLMLEGKLVVEWGELAGLSRHETDEVKRFVSQQEDSYRRPYDRCSIKFQRTAVFVATTNEGQYLRDLTGNRRWWPVRVGTVDIERLRRDAGQLLGEAVAQYRTGARWWFDEHGVEDADLVKLTTGEQMARLVGDAWDDLALDLAEQVALDGLGIIDMQTKEARQLGVGVGARLSELMVAAGIEDSGDSNAKGSRFAKSLRKAGWEPYQSAGRGKWRLPKCRADEIERAWQG